MHHGIEIIKVINFEFEDWDIMSSRPVIYLKIVSQVVVMEGIVVLWETFVGVDKIICWERLRHTFTFNPIEVMFEAAVFIGVELS